MSEEIIKVLEAICDKLGIAVDWTSENVVPYIQELVVRYARYILIMNIILIVTFAIFCCVGVKIFMRLFKEYYNKESPLYLSDALFLGGTISGVIFAVIVIVSGVSIIAGIVPQIIESIVLPEVLFVNMLAGYLG